MNEFHGNYMYRPTEAGKKGRKVKNHRGESCKCFAPFVKLHHHDCPVVMKPCPVHGDLLQIGGRETKVVREQNVIISFHPSSKTEKLLQPIRSLLNHFNSETKINFQYYSPGDSISKESLKPQNGQNAYENLKRSFNNNIFVEKTKSFVANKTNKVKKLKQCFHSPCNSIAQKSLSQSSMKERINQILREEAKQTQNVFYSMVPEVPPDDKKWSSSKKESFKNHEKLFNENSSSDFITVTQQDKNNVIRHKIFEIKHKKGVNDVPFVGFPRQPTQMVYSAINIDGEKVNQLPDSTYDEKEVKNYNNNKSRREQNEETGKKVEVYSAEKTQGSASSRSSSSGSVYITPFIFVPRGMEDTDIGLRSNPKGAIDHSDKAVQEDLITPKEVGSPKQTQTSEPSKVIIPEQTQTLPEPNKEVIIPKPSPIPSKTEKPEMKSVLVQTDSTCDERICHLSRRVYVQKHELHSETRVEEICNGNERQMVKRNSEDDSYDQKQCDVTRRTMDSGHHTRTTEVRTDCPYKEVLVTARWDTPTRDQTSQTEDPWSLQVSVRKLESRINKAQVTVPRLTERGTQTSFCECQHTSDHSEFIQIHCPNATYVIKSLDHKESQQDIGKHEKLWWGKSHSDSELNERLKCDREENENPCMLSEFSAHSQAGKGTTSRVYDSDGVENCSTGGSVTVRTKETDGRYSAMKQACSGEVSAPVSDLTELKIIIQDFFKRGNFSRKSCECDKTVTIKETKTDGETVTDSFILPCKPAHKQEKESVGVGVQTSCLLSKVMPEPEKKETYEREVQTVNREVQTLRKVVSVQTVRNVKNADVQTDISVLLDEGEQKKPGCKNIILRQSVVVDHENGRKTFYVCALCNREVKTFSEASTSTVNVCCPETREGLPLVQVECSDVHQVTVLSKRVHQPSKVSFGNATVHGKQNEESNNQNPKTWKPQESSQVRSTPRSGIPVLAPNYFRLRNEETVRPNCFFLSDYAEENAIRPPGQRSPTVRDTNRECICETLVSPHSIKDPKTLPPSVPTASKSKEAKDHSAPGPSTTKKPREHRRGTSGSAMTENRIKRRQDPFAYPVIISPFCPRDFMKTWNSMESSTNDNPSSDDSKPQTPKSKRTYKKDLELIGTATGKKIKADIEDSTKEYTNVGWPVPTRILKKERFKVWSPLMMDYQSTTVDEQSPASGDDLSENLTMAPRDNSPENKEEEFGDSEDLYDNDNTTRGRETGSMEKKNRKKQRKRKKQENLFSKHFPRVRD